MKVTLEFVCVIDRIVRTTLDNSNPSVNIRKGERDRKSEREKLERNERERNERREMRGSCVNSRSYLVH